MNYRNILLSGFNFASENATTAHAGQYTDLMSSVPGGRVHCQISMTSLNIIKTKDVSIINLWSLTCHDVQ